MTRRGYVFLTGPCWSCGNVMSYSPSRVPSIRDQNGVRQPVCMDCIKEANPRRVALGLSPIVPLDGAYEPTPEDEIY